MDFNPLNTAKPDTALFEGRVEAIGRLLKKCREINPDFCIAAEAGVDRMIPYADVYYRTSNGFNISPLRYVFPEWTSCQHIGAPRAFRSVNGAVLTGSVICVGPETYRASMAHPLYKDLSLYIKEVERIRKELLDIIFLGAYHDALDAEITEETDDSGALHFRVHEDQKTDQRAIVVVNDSDVSRKYRWQFLHADVSNVDVYEPFKPVRTVDKAAALDIKSDGLQILVESH